MIQLISEKNIKAFGLLDENLSYSYIQPILLYIQDLKMTRLLGKPLYEDLMNKVESSATTPLSVEYKKILDNYIKHILLWNVTSYIQIPLNWKFRNQGMVNTNNQDGSNETLSEIQYTKHFFANTAKFYETELVEYLRCNKSNYPLYKYSEVTYNCTINL